MTSEDIDAGSHFADAAPHEDLIIKVIGVGGGGDNAVNHMYAQDIKQVSFVVTNTDRQALNVSPVPKKLLLGPKTLNGMGAGNVPERAREAAEESAEEIAALFRDETKMVFITAGMGGGTGTGAGPVVARIAREAGLLTIGIVTIPFLFEGEKKILKALDGAEEMAKYVDAILVVNNEQLTEIYPDLDWMNAFAKADDTLANAARSISELITCQGHINLDFNDVNTTLKDSGAAIISTGYGEGPRRVTNAINDALNSPLLKNRDIHGSQRLLFNLYFSRKADVPFAMGEAKELTQFISNISGVDVIYGIGFDDSLGNKIKITILAAGFKLVIKGEEATLASVNSNGAFGGAAAGGEANTRRGGRGASASAVPFNPAVQQPKTPTEAERNDAILASTYGAEKVDEMKRSQIEMRYIVLKPEQFNDDEVVEILEHNPTYNRDRQVADKVRQRVQSTHAYGASRRSGASAGASASSNPTPPSADLSGSKVIEFN